MIRTSRFAQIALQATKRADFGRETNEFSNYVGSSGNAVGRNIGLERRGRKHIPCFPRLLHDRLSTNVEHKLVILRDQKLKDVVRYCKSVVS